MKATFFKKNYTQADGTVGFNANVDFEVDLEWQDLVEVLLDRQLSPKKHLVPMYNLWTFNTDDEGRCRRCKALAKLCYGLVLDYDDNLTLTEALELFDGFEAAIYTTYSHSDKQDKFRVVIPFTKPVAFNDMMKKREAMIAAFPGCDKASFTPSQAFYLHAPGILGPSFTCHLEGEMIDPDVFAEVEPVVYQPQNITSDRADIDFSDKDAYTQMMLNSLQTCSDLRYHDSVMLALMIRHAYGSFADYQQVINTIAGHDSSLRNPAVQIQAWQTSDNRNLTATQRDKWIIKWGGTPNFRKPKVSKAKKQLEAVLAKKAEFVQRINTKGL